MIDKELVKKQRKTICKGCGTYYKDQRVDCTVAPIIYKDTDKELTCPCSICLVKMICESGDGCDLISSFMNQVWIKWFSKGKLND